MNNSSSSLFSILKGINISKVLGGANKTLNLVKEAVPIYKEVKPIFKNAKTFLSAYNELKTPSPQIKKTVSTPLKKKQPLRNTTINDSLTFFQ